MTAEEQLALIKSKLAELLGIASGASDEEFASAFDKYIKDTEEEETAQHEASESKAQEAAEEMGKKKDGEMQQMAASYEAKIKEFSSKLASVEKELTEFRAKEVLAARKNFEAEVDAILDGAVKAGKMLPVERASQKAILLTADRATKLEFSDDKGEKVQKTLFESIVESINARPVAVKMEEVSKANVETPDAPKTSTPKGDQPADMKRFSNTAMEIDPNSLKIDSRAREIMAAEKCGYGDAMRKAVKEVRGA